MVNVKMYVHLNTMQCVETWTYSWINSRLGIR